MTSALGLQLPHFFVQTALIGCVKYGQRESESVILRTSFMNGPKGCIGSTWRPCNYGPNHPSALHSLKELMSAAPCSVFASCTNYLIRAPLNATDII